jgi:CPA2 family monovalent cation:H+ antiporter-2
MTVVLNAGAGQFVAWLNKLGPRAGINASVILQNRGEFALILATLSLSAGLDERIQPFAGLYVLIMAIMGPILAANSEKIANLILRPAAAEKAKAKKKRDPMLDEGIALVAAATEGDDVSLPRADDESEPTLDTTPRTETVSQQPDGGDVDALIEQAMRQSDEFGTRERDSEY